MDYDILAEQLLDLRASKPQVKVERKMSKALQGGVAALNYLAAHGDIAHPKDMSEDLILTSARIAAILKTLERRGLVTRQADPIDRRQIIVRLTEAGRAIVQKRKQEMISSVSRTLEALGEEDAKNYVRIQKRLIEMGTFWR